MKPVLMSLAVAVLAAAFVLPTYAASPVALEKVAPVAELVAVGDAKIATLEAALKDGDSYGAAKSKAIPKDAGVLAVVAQALAEHSDKAAWKGAAADVRNAALKLAEAKSYDDAKAALAAVKEAQGGKASGAKAEHDWAKLTSLDNVMTEVAFLNGKVRGALRKTGDDTAEATRQASTLAVLALVAHADTHEVKNKNDISKWQKFAADMQTHMTETATALRAKDAAAAKTAFAAAGKQCAGCHADFKE